MYSNREVKEKVYKENEYFSFGSINIKVKDSYISDLSKNGKTISKDKSYVILLLEFKNPYEIEKEFNQENLGLIVNKKRVQPSLSMGTYFSDFGNPYTGSNIKGKATTNYILVYEIDKHLINGNFHLEAYSRIDTTGDLGIINKEIKLKPTVISSKVTSNIFNKGTNINLDKTSLKKSTLSIKDYELTDRYEYEVCNDGKCITDAKSVYPNKNNKTLIVLDYELILDEESNYVLLNRDYKTFFNDFLEIKYLYNEKEYITKAELLNPENYKDKLIIKVPDTINNAENIYAIVTIRNISYQIKLK